MVSKKFKLLLAIVALLQTASYAQDTTHMSMSINGTDANWAYDSSKISSKNMPQYNEFTNYQNPYPPKPRSQWELSFGGGNAFIIGDRPMFAKQDGADGGYVGGIAGSISARFPLSHVFSGRLGYIGSMQKIPGYKGNNSTFYIPFSSNVTHALTMDLIASLNTISSHRGNPKTNIYVFIGYDLAATQVAKGEKGGFKFKGTVYNGSNPDLPNLYRADENKFITTFHKDAFGNKNQALYHNIDFGGGLAFKLSSKINLAFEERIANSLTGVDFMDGFTGKRGYGQTADKMAYSTVKLNFNLGNPATHTEPLWWINPNNYIYNEVATPKHMKIPIPVLPDADGDGVTDQFDMEPNTPAGCAVDVHGVSLDTDGDGVPDCRDKEKLTPQNCFPVNADGVGTCPEPECCKAIDSLKMQPSCSIGSLPSVQFRNGSATLNATAKSLLDNVAQQLMANPNCKVKLVGYGASDKRAQQLSWDHVNAVKTYLTEKQGISESRIIFTYGMEGTGTTVDLVPTTEEGPNTVPAPHPNLQKSK
ncbi:MAG TPA: OmpA family protein [Parafilimonas sp.]|nr:OmpA family protein [Parafilimonas sp.]